jgi:hypothetical protein
MATTTIGLVELQWALARWRRYFFLSPKKRHSRHCLK